MYRRFLLLVIIALGVLPSASADDSSNRYNVLFIAIDDLRPDLGCYGVVAAQSPHLDRFASSSVLFNNHYVQVATCGASRYALLTGRSPARSGALGNGALFGGKTAIRKEEQDGAQTLPELFRRSGYRTTCIGKISHQPDGRVYAYNGKGDGRPEMPGAWDTLPTPFGPWKRGWGTFFAYAGGRHREDGGGHRDLMEFTAEKDADLPDGMMAETAIEKLRGFKQSGQRFFMGLGFFKPHLPFVAPKQDWDAFAGVEIPLPPQGKIASPYWHRSGEFYKYKAPFAKSQPLSAEAQRRSRRAYLACVRYVDRQVGKVLAAVDELRLADNTIVVVWGDHGWHLGEQQLWGKHSPFERANRSVLIVRVPGTTQVGLKTNALAETIDLYPTLIELCQPKFSKTHRETDGTSLVPILNGEKKAVRDAALSYWRDAVSVRTDRYRLVTKMKSGKPTAIELYDLADDPDSMKNVAKDLPEMVASMKKYLPTK